MTSTTPRPLHKISDEITRTWRRPYYAAAPYIEAMRHVATMEDTYGYETGQGIVTRFLNNAGTWRGEDAKRIKAELKGMLPKRSAR